MEVQVELVGPPSPRVLLSPELAYEGWADPDTSPCRSLLSKLPNYPQYTQECYFKRIKNLSWVYMRV